MIIKQLLVNLSRYPANHNERSVDQLRLAVSQPCLTPLRGKKKKSWGQDCPGRTKLEILDSSFTKRVGFGSQSSEKSSGLIKISLNLPQPNTTLPLFLPLNRTERYLLIFVWLILLVFFLFLVRFNLKKAKKK